MLNPSLKVQVWNTDRLLTFSDLQDASAWADAELSRWEQIKQPTHGRLLKILNQQKNQLVAIRNAAGSADANAVSQHLEPFRQGTLLTSDHRSFPLVLSVGSADGDAAMLLVLGGRSDSSAQLQAIGIQSPLDALIRMAALSHLEGSEAAKEAVSVSSSELARLKNEYDNSLSNARELHASIESLVDQEKQSQEESVRARESDWKDELERVRGDWEKLKLVYDTELGLRAPTTYWKDRAVAHRSQAIGFGAAFSVALGALVFVFSNIGLGYLVGVPSDKPAILAVLPILIPAFAGIWVLRILGRLLSENLHLMRDARERETLVKTFLALMKDDATGKSVVKDEDRILILHSLFRPSMVSAADDAPPVHWFDILANKIGSRQRAAP